MKKITICLLLLFISAPSFADSNDSNFTSLLSLGLNFGGEDLFNFSDGTSLTTAGLISFSIGSTYKAASNIDIQTAFTYNFDNVRAVGGTYSFKETSLELIPFYRLSDTTKIGLGLFHVLSAKISAPIYPATFSSVTGTVLEAQWKLGMNTSIGLRFTNVDLPFETFSGVNVSASGITIDGSYIGLQYYGHF